MQRYLRGQVWWCNCSYDVNSDEREMSMQDKQKLFNHIQQGIRPVLIISNDAGNKFASTIQVIPCTTSEKAELPTHFVLYINKQRNTFLCEQMRTVNKCDLGQYMTTLDEKEMAAIDECIMVALGLKKVEPKIEKINISVDAEPEDTIINKEENNE